MNRIAVRLAIAMVLVVLITSAAMTGLLIYQNDQHVKSFERFAAQQASSSNAAAQNANGNSPERSRPPRTFLTPTSVDGQAAARGEILAGVEPGTRITPSRPVLRRPRSVIAFQEELTNAALLSTGIAALIGGMIAIVLARRIAQPVEAVAAAASSVAGGNPSARVPLRKTPLRNQDEVTRLALSFNSMADHLERQERERKDMIADIAHELRTPLTIMQGRLEAIEDGVVPWTLDEVQRLHRQTRFISRLVDDLRMLSLADAGRLTLRKERTEARRLLENVAVNFQQPAREKGVTLDVDLSAADHAEVNGDPDRLSQVFSNLLDNALRYTPAGGSIRLQAEATRSLVRASVLDSGPGIPPGALTRIFDRFYRGEGERVRASGGSGLGLAIVKTLVELHGGQVEADNQPTGGAAFNVTLPRAT